MGLPAAEPAAAIHGRPVRVAALVALFGLAALQFGWNAAAQPGFWGYDEAAHAAVAFGIHETGALPHPLSGWSTFHPPLNALLGAGSLAILGESSGRVALFGLRLPSLLGGLLLGAALFLAALPRFGFLAAWMAAAIALFLPVTQLAASMVGNEALAAGFAALALLPLLSLQREPDDPRQAVLFGLFAGLACATKFTGLWTLALAGGLLLRPGPRPWRSLALCIGVAFLVAGPFYLRNVATTGTPLPMTRELQPMKHFEERMQFAPRQLADYVGMPWSCGQYPYITVVAEGGGAIRGVNPSMQNVPCLLYAGLWFDPFGIRGGRTGPMAGVGWGVLLLGLGVVPTFVLLYGLGGALRAIVESRGRAEATPLVLLLGFGLGSFAAFTWMAPSLAAAKASYLLPLVVPAGFLFASGLARSAPGVRIALCSASGAAAALAALVFTTGVVFPPSDAAASLEYWTRIGEVLPESHIVEAVTRLLDVPSG
jgi:hypothetical protein